MKLARFESKPPPVTVDIPGVTVEAVTNEGDQVYALGIVVASASVFTVSFIGFGTLAWLHWKKKSLAPSGARTK